MSAQPTPETPATDAATEQQLAQRRKEYVYRGKEDNALAPIAVAERVPWRESYAPSWLIHFVPGYLKAHLHLALHWLWTLGQHVLFRFDKLRAYRALFFSGLPAFASLADSDEAFAYRRLAGANAVSLTQEKSLANLRARLPLDIQRVEGWLEDAFGRSVDLDAATEAGHLFVVDFRLLQSALPRDRTRDSRWRPTYLATSIGVFLELPGVDGHADFVPLAIQIDQTQPDDEPNPVYYPDDRWAWRIAKAFFEAADVSFHTGAGHIYRTHLLLEPFCMATPRQLPESHPIFILLRPHTRFTMPANAAAYKYFTSRSETYYKLYSGTLEETRNISIQDYLARDFRQLNLRRDLEARGVMRQPSSFPYRDDALLWLEPIEQFVRRYVEACYADDDAIGSDVYLQKWAEELMDPNRGAVRRLVEDECLDTRDKLIELLAQVIFTAGPGHASQHYAGNFFYRYSPGAPAASHTSPPWKASERDEARWLQTLPNISLSRLQYAYNSFANFKYDRFGSYERYPLGTRPEAREAIEELRSALVEVQKKIDARNTDGSRLLEYPFLSPSEVPNSTTI